MKFYTLKKGASAVLAAVAFAGLQLPQAMAKDNPFRPASSDDYILVAADTATKCGGGMGMGAGNKGCGMMRMDSNNDGKVSRDEFMQGHAAMFEKIDANGDGVLDANEWRAHKAMMKEGKMGKCGGMSAE